MKQNKILSGALGLWGQLPVIVKAIVAGYLVSTLGIALWIAAFSLVPLPWSILPMLAVLWLYWKYFSGRGTWFKAGANIRATYFRSVKLEAHVWKWGLAAAVLFIVIVQSGFVITFRLIEMPDAFTSEYRIIETMPRWIAWLTIVMSSVVAGICEEAGYRGYMQVPLEKKYGPLAAITVVSIIFVLIHLSKAWAAPIIPVIFFASVLLGLLAYRTGSIVPGIIGHAILDVFDYACWWTNLVEKSKRLPVFVSGVDGHFVIWGLVLLLSTSLFFAALKKINIRRKIR